jgi:hypothetical protein
MNQHIQAKDSENMDPVNKSMMAKTLEFRPTDEIKIAGLQDQRFCSLELKERAKDRTNTSWTKPKQQMSAMP